MSRRVALPGASELFRPTQAPEAAPVGDGQAPTGETAVDGIAVDGIGAPVEERTARGTGRVRHDEKITVYVSSDELVALEQARLTMRARHGLAVDRGRIVREAILAAIADLETNGDDSELVRRLSSS